MLLAKEEEEQWGFSTAEAAALAIDEVAQLRRNLANTVATAMGRDAVQCHHRMPPMKDLR